MSHDDFDLQERLQYELLGEESDELSEEELEEEME